MYGDMTESELEDFASKAADQEVMTVLKSLDIYIKDKERVGVSNA